MRTRNAAWIFLLLISAVAPVQAQVRITDNTHYDTASQMLLANEINESGEPFAEALGYDLDILDPFNPNFPDRAAYVLGIENYEYSRYQLGAVISRSGVGLHMMWAPVIGAMAAMQPDDFDGSMTGGMANGYKEDDMLMMMVRHFGHLAGQMPPANPWPQFGEFVSADPHYAGPVDPDHFTMDFSSLRWDRNKMDKRLSPGAMGQTLMKQYLWAQDMLSGFHDADGEGIDPDGVVSPDGPDGVFDPDNGVFFGGDGADGFIGQVLTAEAINKIKNLIDNLAYDGHSLGAVNPMTYDPAMGLKYFPHLIAVNEEMVPGLPPRAGTYSVDDPSSDLFDQSSLLWGALNFSNMMDPGNSSDAAHLAYHNVFDGDPFPAAMMTTGQPGPYDLMKGTSKVVFQNLMAMHFDADAGTFVDRSRPRNSAWGGDDDGDDEDKSADRGMVRRGRRVSAVNVAYALVALDVFQREFAGTPLATMALDAMRAQADFLIDRMGNRRDLYSSKVTLRRSDRHSGDRFRRFRSGKRTVEAQAAAIRGLYAAYSSTGDQAYLEAADRAYEALISKYKHGDAFATRLHKKKARYTPRTVALLAGALREARLVGGHEEAADHYVAFWDRVANRMQLAEGGPTGEMGGDSDLDGIPFIPETLDGVAPVFASRAVLRLNGRNKSGDDLAETRPEPKTAKITLLGNEPNPFNPQTNIRFELGSPAHVDLAVYDVRGKLVERLLNREMQAGPHSVSFQADNVASGVYYYVLQGDAGRQVGKMVLLK